MNNQLPQAGADVSPDTVLVTGHTRQGGTSQENQQAQGKQQNKQQRDQPRRDAETNAPETRPECLYSNCLDTTGAGNKAQKLLEQELKRQQAEQRAAADLADEDYQGYLNEIRHAWEPSANGMR
jgi:hypothetical protein